MKNPFKRKPKEIKNSMLDLSTLENSEILIRTHWEGQCQNEICSVHNRSDHPMRSFPQWWRSDRKIMERICDHGVGHPDPDDFKIVNKIDDGVHGCDGCCRG